MCNGTRYQAWPGQMLRVGFGGIWLVDAYLKWQPAFQAHFLGILHEAAMGQPAWLRGWFQFWMALVSHHVHAFALATAVTESYFALALLAGFARRPTYLLGAGYSLLIWATAEGFGGLSQTGATDIGAAVIYAVVFLALLAVPAPRGGTSYCLHAMIARRLRWWQRVAAT